MNLADTAAKTRRKAAVHSGELQLAWMRSWRHRIEDVCRRPDIWKRSRLPSGDQPPQTRLFRPRLRAFQRTIRRLAGHTDVWRARSCAVIVASAAGADQLRRTFENRCLSGASPADRALGLPQILTRSGWYDGMHSRLPSPPRRLTDLEREVLLNAAARDAAATEEPPFRLRAGLLVEMLALYDDLRRRDSSVDDFERVLVRELQRDADDDRGAARLLKQTRFLAAAFRGYEARRDATGAVDEYALRTLLLEVEPTRPLRQVVLTVGERSVDSAGLCPRAGPSRRCLSRTDDIVATHAHGRVLLIVSRVLPASRG